MEVLYVVGYQVKVNRHQCLVVRRLWRARICIHSRKYLLCQIFRTLLLGVTEDLLKSFLAKRLGLDIFRVRNALVFLSAKI